MTVIFYIIFSFILEIVFVWRWSTSQNNHKNLRNNINASQKHKIPHWISSLKFTAAVQLCVISKGATTSQWPRDSISASLKCPWASDHELDSKFTLYGTKSPFNIPLTATHSALMLKDWLHVAHSQEGAVTFDCYSPPAAQSFCKAAQLLCHSANVF